MTLIDRVGNSGAMPALVKTMVFNQARLNVIAENVANATTPGYKAKQLDARKFQNALRGALDHQKDNPGQPFVVEAGSEVKTDDAGYLQVTPSVEPVDNILFHDGTNLSLEQEMSDLAETGMMQQLATTLLTGYYDAYRKAIRGTVA